MTITDPWNMTDFGHVDSIIELLHKLISKEHPLYNRKVFPMAHRDQGRLVIFETDDSKVEEYYIVDFSENSSEQHNPPTELIEGQSNLVRKMDVDLAEYLSKLPTEA